MINLAAVLNTGVANPIACKDQAGNKQSGEDVAKTEDVFSRVFLTFSALGMRPLTLLQIYCSLVHM